MVIRDYQSALAELKRLEINLALPAPKYPTIVDPSWRQSQIATSVFLGQFAIRLLTAQSMLMDQLNNRALDIMPAAITLSFIAPMAIDCALEKTNSKSQLAIKCRYSLAFLRAKFSADNSVDARAVVQVLDYVLADQPND